MIRRRALHVAKLALFAVLVAAAASARPGGGHTYSGGGGGSHVGGGGGGGGGGGELVFFLIRVLFDLCIEAPAIGIPLVIAIVVGFAILAARNKGNRDWNGPSAAAVVASRGLPRNAANLSPITATDPDFSRVLFEDFVYALFAAAHRARTDPKKLAELAPYLNEEVRAELARRAPGEPVSTVVVGAMRLLRVAVGPAETRIDLELEANLLLGGGRPRTIYETERWTLSRRTGLRSRPWGEARTFLCPNCGAPFESTDSTVCRYCNTVVTNGRFDWSVASATVVEQKDGPPNLRGTVPEEGTDLRTVFDAGFGAAWATLTRDDPSVTEESVEARLSAIHAEVNRTWNSQDLAPARPFVSDGLFDYLGYWIQAYRAQGLRNVVDDARVTGTELVKLVRDRHYDALTVRVFATGKDYTLDQSGAVVGGSRTRDRDYSEYWTLIRGAGTRGAPKSDRECPNCGAELRVEMSGACSYCHVRVTTGRFSWVLSKIEQDDSYAG
ncbi:MAG TPA: TIM44-like domain-containing protein [Polyangiaceae bacterium]|nr:TIM44-like domain-containing protein [Polyangiaceae bacterium]